MALVRVKKLTDAGYAPTNPATEAEARLKVDDSIQEVLDLLDADKASTDEVLTKTNTDVYTPTTQYHPATKGYVDGVAISATIPLDSLTDNYLSSTPGNIKPRVATIESDLGTAQTDINNLETDVDIINTAVSDTGLVNAMAINTAGTFDMAKNGNVTPFIIPLFTNTGTATLSIDGGAVTGIRKANDAGTLVVLEAGDIKKNVPVQFVLDTVSGFFVYAPKGGSKTYVAIPKYSGNVATTSMTQQLSVTGSGWVVAVHVNTSTVADGNWRIDIDGTNPMASTNKTTMSYQGSLLLLWRYNSSFQFYSAVSGDYMSISYIQDSGTKNIEKGVGVFRKATNNATVSATTQVLSVSGSGVLTGLSRQYTTALGYDIVIDGIEVLTDVRVDNTLLLMFPFKTSLLVRCSNASDYVVAYQLN